VQASELLLSELDDDGILRLTLNDAGRRNALSEAMLRATLGVAFARAASDSTQVLSHL
jgi:enoyl-CoA hydratase/carnithine racemase